MDLLQNLQDYNLHLKIWILFSNTSNEIFADLEEHHNPSQ